MAPHRTLSWLKTAKTAENRVGTTTWIWEQANFAQQLPISIATRTNQSDAASPTGSIELVPASVSIPTDNNVGEPTQLSKTVASVLGRPNEEAPNKVHMRYPDQSMIKLSASSELLKIDDLTTYMAACAEYSQGLAAKFTEERLLAIVTKWRTLDQGEKDKWKSNGRYQN